MIRRIVLGLAALLLLAGCGARQAETRNPDMLICAWISGPDGFNPLTAISSASRMIEDEIYTPLVDIGPNLLPRWSSSLAYRIDVSDGGKRYVLHLRRNARWSDGTPLTARDVVFAIRLGENPSVIAGNSADFTLMRSVRAIGRYTVEIRLSHPSPPFLENALGETYALPAHVLERYPPASNTEAAFVNADAAYAQHPLVYGAFRILRNVPDSYLILAPNPSYWGTKPSIPEIAFRVYPQQDSLYAAVDAGEVDVTNIPPNLWRVHDRLQGRHRFVTWPWNVTFYLLPNFEDPAVAFIRERAVRQAMMYAIDRRFIVEGIMNGQADVLNGPVPSFSPYYDRHEKTYAYDPARARALLEAAGWKMHDGVRMKNGVALRLTLKTGGATDAVASNIAELIQANLRAVGIDCRLQNEELQTFFADLQSSRFELALRGVILPAYPDDYRDFASTQTRAHGGYNLGSYDNPQADRDMLAARTAATPQAARRALDTWQELASRDLPALFLYSNRLAAVVPEDLRGYDLSPISPAALPGGLQFWRIQR